MPVEVAFPGSTVEITSSSSVVEIVQEGLGSIVIEGAMGSAAIYGGPYAADALFRNQVFATNEKLMRDDFTVRAINYTEAQNATGITVTIGG